MNVLSNTVFLERLTDDELLSLCRASRSMMDRCSVYIKARVKKRKIVLSSAWIEDFKILAAYSEQRITLSDALIRSIFARNSSMTSYFRSLSEQRCIPSHLNTQLTPGSAVEFGKRGLVLRIKDVALFASLIGYILIGDLESLRSAMEPHRHPTSEQANAISRMMGALIAVSILRGHDEITKYLEKCSGMMVEDTDLGVLGGVLSVDLIKYIFRFPRRWTPITSLEEIFVDAGICANDMTFLRLLHSFLSKRNVFTIHKLVIHVICKEDMEFLDEIITPYNYDVIVKEMLSYDYAENYFTILFERYPQYIGIGSRLTNDIWNAMNSKIPSSILRRLIEIMSKSVDTSTSRLAKYVLGEGENLAKELISKMGSVSGTGGGFIRLLVVMNSSRALGEVVDIFTTDTRCPISLKNFLETALDEVSDKPEYSEISRFIEEFLIPEVEESIKKYRTLEARLSTSEWLRNDLPCLSAGIRVRPVPRLDTDNEFSEEDAE